MRSYVGCVFGKAEHNPLAIPGVDRGAPIVKTSHTIYKIARLDWEGCFDHEGRIAMTIGLKIHTALNIFYNHTPELELGTIRDSNNELQRST